MQPDPYEQELWVTSSLWFFLIPLVWIAGVVAASVWYRRAKGRAVFPQAPVGALFAACTGLQQDWRYRQAGVATTATYANPDPRLDEQSKAGVLTYSIAGVGHRLTSLSGVGLFKVGETEQVYYLPSDPQDARESGYVYFDLLWLGLGSLALTLSLFGGLIVRRIMRSWAL